MATLSGFATPQTGASKATWLVSVLLGLIGLSLAGMTLAGGLTTAVEAGLAAAGMTVSSVFFSVAYLEARTLDRIGGSR